MVPIYMKQIVEVSEKNLLKYCEENLGLVNPRICVKKIKVQSLIRWNGYYLHITGRTGPQLIVRNAVPFCLKQKWINYIKAINGFVEKNLSEDDETSVTKELNEELFQIIADKHAKGIYAKRPNSIAGKIIEWQEKFNKADLASQVEAIYEILKITECANYSMKAKKLGFSVTQMLINKKISLAEEFLLINQSPSGLYESVTDLLKV